MSSETQTNFVQQLQLKDDEKIVSNNLTVQEESRLDSESLSVDAENRENTENEVGIKEDKEGICEQLGYSENTVKTDDKVGKCNSIRLCDKDTSTEAESVRDIDKSFKTQNPESTVCELVTLGETERKTSTRGDFELEVSESEAEEFSAMGAFFCSNSQDEDKRDRLHEEAKKKMQKTSKDDKKYKQLTLHSYGHQERSKDVRKYKQSTLPYYQNQDRATRRKEREKNESAHFHKQFIDKDTGNYRHGYPGKQDNLHLNDNLRFYRGEIQSTPKGAYIDEIHEKWWGDYELLERHHGYIQWLFPIRESGMNIKAQPLQLHEAEAIKADQKTKERVLRSYKLILDFYGMKLQNDRTGKLERSENWKKCFDNLNCSRHNYLRITRILKCLGELGYERLKKGFIQFVLEEALIRGTLVQTLTSCRDYWIGTIKNDSDREELYRYIDEHEAERSW